MDTGRKTEQYFVFYTLCVPEVGFHTDPFNGLATTVILEHISNQSDLIPEEEVTFPASLIMRRHKGDLEVPLFISHSFPGLSVPGAGSSVFLIF